MKNVLMSYDEKEVAMDELAMTCHDYDPWHVYGSRPCTVGFLNCPFGKQKGEICESVTEEMWERILLDRRVRIC